VTPIGFTPGDSGRDLSEPPRIDIPTGHQPATDAWDQWREAEPIIWQIWQTSSDERVCPICGPYQGRIYLASDGPFPPLHANCRCQRTHHHTEWRLRE